LLASLHNSVLTSRYFRKKKNEKAAQLIEQEIKPQKYYSKGRKKNKNVSGDEIHSY